MKSTLRTITTTASISSTTPSSSFYTYLKPGALAKLRYTNITARSKQHKAQSLLALTQLDSAFSHRTNSTAFDMDRIPCFNFRVSSYPRCRQRKRLIAVAPAYFEA